MLGLSLARLHAQTISTIAGNGNPTYAGDNGPATAASLNNPYGIAVDSSGNIYVADYLNNRVRKIAVGTGIITTFAGTGSSSGSIGDGGPASAATLNGPTGVAFDSTSGSLLIAEFNRVRRVNLASGVITTVAGSGTTGNSGNGGPATSATLNGTTGVAVDSAGNFYIADGLNVSIRKVTVSTGIITTVAGGPLNPPGGDGGPATAAGLTRSLAIAVDSTGSLYIGDTDRVRKVSAATGIITTFAGGGPQPFGEGVPATSVHIEVPLGLAVDSSGNLYIAETNGSRVRRVNGATGVINYIVGGFTGFDGDGGPAATASVFHPSGIALEPNGNLVFTDTGNQRVRRVTLVLPAGVQASPATLDFGTIFVGSTSVPKFVSLANGTGTAITISNITVAGDFNKQSAPSASCANGGTVAAGASCYLLVSLSPTATGTRNGTLTFADSGAGSPHTIALTGIGRAGTQCATASTACDQMIATLAGDGAFNTLDGIPAISAALFFGGAISANQLTFDPGGNLLIADPGSGRIRVVAADTGIINTVAGHSGPMGALGDGGPATAAGLNTPNGVALDAAGNLYIGDSTNHRIRRVSAATGIITTIAGTGTVGFSGDGGPATSAMLQVPAGIAVDAAGNVYFADSYNHRVRRIAAGTGIITTVAGNGVSTYGGDGGAAVAASLNYPVTIALDSSGNLYIADAVNNRIRRVSALNNIITTFAGNGTAAPTGDGGPATAASLNGPTGIAFDNAGNLLIADSGNHRVRRVAAATGTITTIAGTGANGFDGDGGLALDATFNWPSGIAVDAVGNIVVADAFTNRVRIIGVAQRLADTLTGRSINTASATAAVLRPTCGSQSVAHGVLVKYVPPVSGTASFDLNGSSYQTLAAVFTAAGSGGALQQVACQEAQVRVARDGQRVVVQPKPTITVTAGQDVWVLITSVTGPGGTAVVTPTFRAAAAVPAATFTSILPHVVTGGGFLTKLTLVNMSGSANSVAVNFVDDQGTVLSSTTRILQAAETLRIATPEASRNGAIGTQWASISAEGRVVANLFFEVGNTATAITNTVGFNDDAGAVTFTIPVELQPDDANGVTHTVGLALSNPNATAQSVQLGLRNSGGASLGTANVNLAPYGHTQLALNASNAFGSVLPASNFIGSVTGTSSQGVNVVALGDDFGPFFATPPLQTATRLVIPHLVSGNFGGAGYVTRLTLVNGASISNTVTIQYFNQQGLQVSPVGLATSLLIAANGTARIATPEALRFGAGTVIWALVTSSAPLGANLFFEVATPTGTVFNTIGFNNAPELADFTLPVELEPATQATPAGRTVGIALANANGASATIQLTLLNGDGTTRGTAAIPLAAMSQTVASLQGLFNSLPNGNFVGSLVVHSNVPIAAIALEDDYGPFSALPVVSGHP